MKAGGSVYLGDLKTSLPFLNDKTDSEAHIHPEHVPRYRVEKCLLFGDAKGVPEEVWCSLVHDTMYTNVDSETDVVSYLVSIYKGIIRGLKLEEKLEIITTRIVAANECDIVIASRNSRIPLSIIEAKKPHSLANDQSIFGLNHQATKTLGQNYDQLHNAKFMNGFERVYGMISTGNCFMLTCTDPFLENELQFIDTPEGSKDEKGISPEQKRIFRPGLESKNCFSGNIPDELYTSQLLRRDRDTYSPVVNTSILMMMILLVNKAWTNFVKLSTENIVDLPLSGYIHSRQIELTPNKDRSGYRQNFSTIELQRGWQKSLDSYAKKDDVVSLIRRLGAGVNGECCLAISKYQKRSCAVKFFHEPSKTDAKTEKLNWDRVYGTDIWETTVVELGEKKGCLVMPYVNMSHLDRKTVLENNAKLLRTALTQFSRRNDSDEKIYYLHTDVKWRHLGYFQRNLMLVDLGHVNKTDNILERNDWIEKSVEMLKESAYEHVSNGTPQSNKRAKAQQ